jgi:hypothetical protein
MNYEELATRIDAHVAFFEAHPDAQVRERMTELLQLIDLLHRAPLKRLATLLETYAWDGGGSLPPLERAHADHMIRRLLELYGLVPDAASESQAAVVSAEALLAEFRGRRGGQRRQRGRGQGG